MINLLSQLIQYTSVSVHVIQIIIAVRENKISWMK